MGVCRAGLLVAFGLVGCASSETPQETRPPSLATAVDSSLTQPELRAALLELRDRDQDARAVMVEFMQTADRDDQGRMRFGPGGAEAIEAVGTIDTESAAFLRTMLTDHGWPTCAMVGQDGASAAWILAQHADDDPALQRRVLDLMEPLVADGQARPQDFALLTDRVALAEGQPQVYATQFVIDQQGQLRPSPTSDWDTVDARRASVGLDSMAAYADRLGESYGDRVLLEPMPMEPSREASGNEPLSTGP